ncbi:dihydrolipoyl dehydrogenase [Halarcobacter sp.]|uniref:dihydrolipoyl dehydrogenase n=1 Tax=Halarcobacter sp. TaxID=2321133 RepID=UPI0029F4F1A4|nr:dihydrolipoyl dehydrogenase [Halarcobacter sp.]
MYDVVVIGAGPAGYEIASLLGEGGKSVCLIEKDEEHLGGTCLNWGCVPAKNFLESAIYTKKASYFKECGVDFTLNGFDIDKLKSNTCRLICDTKTGIFKKLKKAKAEIKYGTASFVDENSIKVNDEIIEASEFIIATGSNHREHPLMKIDKGKIISSKEVFTLDKLPESILIVGGGAIGCEFATFFHSLGVKTHIAEFTPKLLPIEDDDMGKTIKREFERSGIKVDVKANIIEYEVLEDGVQVTLDLGKKQEVLKFDKVLISIGRVPNTSELNLEKANIASDNGFVEVDSNLQSETNKKIYAIGDVIRSPALAHVAYYEAKRVANKILNHEALPQKAIFPSVTFCSPQVASIGESEYSLKEQGVKFKTKKVFFKTSAKAKIKGDDSGFIKIIYDEESETILGAGIVGNEATELIHQFLVAINAKLTLKDLSKMIFAHPTLSESTLEVFGH